MYSTILFLLFIAFLILYSLSNKIKWENKPAWATALAARPILSRAISICIIILAGLLLVNYAGLGAGLFSLVIILMAAGCVIVLLYPLKYIRIQQMILIYLCSVTLEFILTHYASA